jgi:hypothetical protein
MLKKYYIRLNNWVTRIRSVRVPAENLLLLAPRCLQNSDCGRNVVKDIDQCRACGLCNVGDLLKIRDEFGIQCNLAAGGREAVASVQHPSVKAVIAVACEKELYDGIRACFPKPVLGIANQQTNGPCHNTMVNIEEVRAAVRLMRTMPVVLPEQEAVEPLEDLQRN